MKTIMAYCLFISFCLLSSLTLAATPVTLTDAKQTESFLFVLQSESAVLTKTERGYELTIKDTNPKTLFFTDRPIRKAGLMTTETFMQRWMRPGSSFGKIPPNAVLVLDPMKVDKQGIAHAVAVELKDPVAAGPNAWKFQLRDLEGSLNVGNYNRVTVFIDPFKSHKF